MTSTALQHRESIIERIGKGEYVKGIAIPVAAHKALRIRELMYDMAKDGERMINDRVKP